MKYSSIKFLDAKFKHFSKLFDGELLHDDAGVPLSRSIFTEQIAGFARSSIKIDTQTGAKWKICPAKFEWLILYSLGMIDVSKMKFYDFEGNKKIYNALLSTSPAIKLWREGTDYEFSAALESGVKVTSQIFEDASNAYEIFIGKTKKQKNASKQTRRLQIVSGLIIKTEEETTTDNLREIDISIHLNFPPTGIPVRILDTEAELRLDTAVFFIETKNGAKLTINGGYLENSNLQLLDSNDINGRTWFKLKNSDGVSMSGAAFESGGNVGLSSLPIGTISWAQDEFNKFGVSLGLGEIQMCNFRALCNTTQKKLNISQDKLRRLFTKNHCNIQNEIILHSLVFAK